jgi:hypothetical protein
LFHNWSISSIYLEEKGGGSKSGSSLTCSNGIKALTLGARYTRGGKTNTVMVNMKEVGGATITSVTGAELAKYKTYRVAQFGLKIAFAF